MSSAPRATTPNMTNSTAYLSVMQELYALYAPLVYDTEGEPVLDANGVQQRQDMPDEPEYPGEGPTYDNMNPENNDKI